MSTLETVASIIGGVAFLACVGFTWSWVRRGCPLPKWLRVAALGCFAAGAALGVGLVIAGGRSIWIALACAAGFPSAMYAGWLWMGGPAWDEEGKAR